MTFSARRKEEVKTNLQLFIASDALHFSLFEK